MQNHLIPPGTPKFLVMLLFSVIRYTGCQEEVKYFPLMGREQGNTPSKCTDGLTGAREQERNPSTFTPRA